MTDLILKGLFTYDQLLQEDEAHGPGVYVWGFEIEGEFTPYYVGEDTSSVFRRISEHIADILKEGSTYKRITEAYFRGIGIKAFYNDPHFPLYYGNSDDKKLIEAVLKYEKQEDYYKRFHFVNQSLFFKHYNPVRLSENSKVQDIPGKDIFTDWIKAGQFRVLYWPLSDFGTYNSKVPRHEMEVFEAFVKLSLLGKTASKSLSSATMIDRSSLLGLGLDELVVTTNYKGLNLTESIFKNTVDHEFERLTNKSEWK